MSDLAALPEIVAFSMLIAREHFGEHVERVAKSVHGVRKTLKMIVEHTKLGFRDVRNALLVLMQHNIVHVIAEGEGDAQQEFYHLKIKSLLVRTRFPRFVEHVQTIYSETDIELGWATGSIIQHICLHGRITTADLMRDLLQQAQESQVAENPESEPLSQKSLERALNRLTVDHYVVRAAASTKGGAASDVVPGKDTATARKRTNISKTLGGLGAKKRKVVSSSAKDMPLEMQMLLNMGNGNGTSDTAQVAAAEDAPAAEVLAEVNFDPKTIWTVDTEVFHLHFRNEACFMFVSELVSEDAAIILHSGMKAALAKGGVAQNRKQSPPLTLAEVRDAVPSNIEFSKEILTGYLDTMSIDNFKILTKATLGTTHTYRINYSGLVQAMQKRHLECVVFELSLIHISEPTRPY
eukprot:TRINITY_DN16694_c0_g1_i2.p1 TRINITY_DN16694_c0_g1~~TRINITY_DN16694_c0_g1_i2.p1  ORF type:complete len:409 (+),score=125.81 TRINITY_DN16694_c0_g1_i2:257-1483(+)